MYFDDGLAVRVCERCHAIAVNNLTNYVKSRVSKAGSSLASELFLAMSCIVVIQGWNRELHRYWFWCLDSIQKFIRFEFY